MPHKCKLARALVAALFVSLTALSGSASGQSYGPEGFGSKVEGWMRFEPKGEEFSIRMPTPPKVFTHTERDPRSKATATVHDYMAMGPKYFGGRNDEIRYIITTVKLPGASQRGDGATVKRADFDKIMYEAQQQFEKGLQKISWDIALDSPREVLSGLHTGRECAIRVGSWPKGRVRFFATATHLYIVGYVGDSLYGPAFFDSLELKNDNRLVISR